MSAFVEFPKIARLSRRCVVTEKIDGTNAQVYILDGRDPFNPCLAEVEGPNSVPLEIRAGSRNRYISLYEDNTGFASWVRDHAAELAQLGPGRHYGEWWGYKIQRGYGLSERRFSLFNVSRWSETRPACCHVVPVLYDGIFDTNEINDALDLLREHGSQAAPGFMRPEGVVVWHEPQGFLFKKTLERDEEHKGARQ
jgi:hypothetical protein